jgi:hypothetical protein
VLELPSNAEAAQLLERLGASSEDRDEALAARPDPREHPELWRHLLEGVGLTNTTLIPELSRS